jgi:siroheme synthase-like protein
MASSYYPLFLSLAGKLCIVIGGGKVAERKVQGLLKAHAQPRIISPEVTKGIRRLRERGVLEVFERDYREGDLEGACLAFAATDKREINERVREESIARAIPLNIADSPDHCGFIVPSVIRKGPVTVAVSTSGQAPMLSKKLKDQLAEVMGSHYGSYVKKVGAFREFLILHVKDGRKRREVLKRLAQADVAEVSGMGLREMKRRFLEEKDQ